MNYLLAVLTCGRPDYLRRTLRAYATYLDPPPAAVYAWDDGHTTPPDAFDAFAGTPVTVEGDTERVGRCSGHARLWRHAAASGHDWVFTVEDDIVLLRPLNLRHMAEVIDAEPRLAQLALVRCPWGAEIEHGGYIPMFPDRYHRHTTPLDARTARWISSTVDWTSSPALLPASLTRAVEWPEGHDCELLLGPRILAQHPGAVSGYFGWGEPWCAHIGIHRVAGGHGY